MTYPISFVECLRHNVQIVCDEAIKAKQTWGLLQRNMTLVLTPERNSNNTTYALCPRVDVDNKLSVEHSTPQRPLWVFMMRKVEAEDFPVNIVPVDLEESKKKIG
jgi:hypothetical protein